MIHVIFCPTVEEFVENSENKEQFGLGLKWQNRLNEKSNRLHCQKIEVVGERLRG